MPPVRRGAIDLTPVTSRPPKPVNRGRLFLPQASSAPMVGQHLADVVRAEDDFRNRAIELGQEERPPVVRLHLTDRVIDRAGWLEVRPYLVAWCQAGAAWIELDGGKFPSSAIATVGDVADLYGCHLVIVDHDLARDALAILRPAKAAGTL